MKTFNELREARLDREENRALARERSRRSRVACPHCGAHVGGKAPAPCLDCERASRKGDPEPIWYDAAMIATSIVMEAKTGMYSDSTFADVLCFSVAEFEPMMVVAQAYGDDPSSLPLRASQEGVRLAQIEFEKDCARFSTPLDADDEDADETVERYLAEEDRIAWESMRTSVEQILGWYRGDFLRLIAVGVRAGADAGVITGLRQSDGETFLEFMDRFHEARVNGIFRAAVKATMEATDRA